MTNEVHDLAALYVVDALPDDESLDFEHHLASCAECQKEVAEMRRVTEMLSSSVAADPPDSLRSSVLASIAATAQVPTDQHSSSPHATQSGPAEEHARDTVVPLRPRRVARLPHLVAAAALLIAVGFGGWALQSRHDAQQATAAQANLVSLLGASDVHTVSGSASNGGSGTVVLSQERGEALFVGAGLPALPSSQVYQLWTITDAPVPAGTFTSSGGGSVVTLPTAALSADQIAVTVEPKGGSQQPTTTPVLAVDVPPST